MMCVLLPILQGCGLLLDFRALGVGLEAKGAGLLGEKRPRLLSRAYRLWIE